MTMRSLRGTAARLSACAALALIPAVAQAQDAREIHFNGPYVAVFGGYSFQPQSNGDALAFDTNLDGTFNDTVGAPGNSFAPGFCGGYANSNLPGTGCGNDRDGGEFGARLGFDARPGGGSFVIGGLIEANKADVRDATSGYSATPRFYTIERDMDFAVSARARIGFTPGGGALFYVTGGGSYAQIKHNFITSNTTNSFTPNDDSDWVWGWQAGGGAEVMVTDNISLGLEYLYNRYTDVDYVVRVGPSTPGNVFTAVNAGGTDLRNSDSRLEFHTVRAVVGFRF